MKKEQQIKKYTEAYNRVTEILRNTKNKKEQKAVAVRLENITNHLLSLTA